MCNKHILVGKLHQLPKHNLLANAVAFSCYRAELVCRKSDSWQWPDACEIVPVELKGTHIACLKDSQLFSVNIVSYEVFLPSCISVSF